jgi:signal transduction histidine kinase
MLKGLRLKLTFLYLLVGMLLVAMVGISTYTLLSYFFQNSNDAALQFKMALVYRSAGQTPPDVLLKAEKTWLSQNRQPFLSFTGHNETDEMEETHDLEGTGLLEEAHEGELASVFVLPLDESGKLLFNPNPYPILMEPDLKGVEYALNNGSDIRNGWLNDGTPVRILTYALPKGSGYDLVQVGKPTGDQFRVLNQFLSGLLVVGAISILLLGLGSWWMAGNSLQPTQQAWDRQQKFIANASHELRTPLTLIRASAELALRRSDPNSLPAQLMGDVIQESDHMTSLVEDMLLLSRLDAQQLKFNFTPIAVPTLLEDIQRQFSPLLQEKNLQLTVQPVAGSILADEARLRQVLLILLDNAIRHTPSGGALSLSAQRIAKEIELSVTDTGEGIPADALSNVFERFYQVQDSRSTHGSSGLGLSIAKSLAEAMNGSIKIESQPGEGTTVSINLLEVK